MFTYLRNAYYLSLPVVLGAVFSNRMAARLSDVEPVHWATPIVLALAVFIIYTVDRLLDVRKPTQPLTARHAFHRQRARLLTYAVGGAAGLALILTFFLPSSVIWFGIALGAVCAAYVGLVYRLPARHPALLLKEPLVALLYSAGVWGSVWVQRERISAVDVVEGLLFAAVAFQNLLLFALMERREPGGSSAFSLVSAWGEARSETILRWLTVVVVVTAFILCFVVSGPGGGPRFAQRSALMLGLMSLVLHLIQRYPTYFLRQERYRWLGDGVFWMPALVL